MAGANCVQRSIVVTSTEKALDVGDIATCGFAIFYHTGKKSDGTATTDTVSIRPASGATALAKLKAGEVALFRLAANAPYVIASSTGGPIVEYVIVVD